MLREMEVQLGQTPPSPQQPVHIEVDLASGSELFNTLCGLCVDLDVEVCLDHTPIILPQNAAYRCPLPQNTTQIKKIAVMRSQLLAQRSKLNNGAGNTVSESEGLRTPFTSPAKSATVMKANSSNQESPAQSRVSSKSHFLQMR